MFWKFAGLGGAIGAGLAAACQGILSFIGFTSAGVAAGSFAAAVQGSAVAAGSIFSILQSVGAGLTLLSISVMAPIVGLGVALGSLFFVSRKKSKS